MRAIHFIATISVVGSVFFAGFVSEPVFCAATRGGDVTAPIRAQIAWIGWVSLVAAVISGAGWLIFLARQLSGLPMTEILLEGPLWTVFSQTDFGQLSLARFILAALLAGAMFFQQSPRRR